MYDSRHRSPSRRPESYDLAGAIAASDSVTSQQYHSQLQELLTEEVDNRIFGAARRLEPVLKVVDTKDDQESSDILASSSPNTLTTPEEDEQEEGDEEEEEDEEEVADEENHHQNLNSDVTNDSLYEDDIHLYDYPLEVEPTYLTDYAALANDTQETSHDRYSDPQDTAVRERQPLADDTPALQHYGSYSREASNTSVERSSEDVRTTRDGRSDDSTTNPGGEEEAQSTPFDAEALRASLDSLRADYDLLEDEEGTLPAEEEEEADQFALPPSQELVLDEDPTEASNTRRFLTKGDKNRIKENEKLVDILDDILKDIEANVDKFQERSARSVTQGESRDFPLPPPLTLRSSPPLHHPPLPTSSRSTSDEAVGEDSISEIKPRRLSKAASGAAGATESYTEDRLSGGDWRPSLD